MPAVPECLGKYTITETIGRGAMGIVYKAFDPGIRRTVAIKTIRKELIEGGETRGLAERFRNEAQAAGRLSHPGIIAVYDFGEELSLAYLVMEFVEGTGLDEYLKRGTRFAAKDIVSIMAQVLDALDFAHAQGVVHRDIKPSNLIVTSSGRVKVADFGIARMDASDFTQVGMMLGTPGYMAPEQYLGAATDRRADIFAAGVIFYQMISGTKPFTGSVESISHRICNEEPPPPSQVDPVRGLRQFDPVVLRALAKKPDDRFQTAAEFRDAMLEAYRAPVSPLISEETIIREADRPVAPAEATSPSRHPSGSGTTGYPPGWDVELLKAVERELARAVGPVARVMIKRAGRATTNLDRLYEMLGEEISDARDRTAFFSSRATLPGARPARDSAAPTPTRTIVDTHLEPTSQRQPIGPETLDRAQAQLAKFLGPIARVLVKKSAARAANPREFYLWLAEQIASDEDRRRFLDSVGIL